MKFTERPFEPKEFELPELSEPELPVQIVVETYNCPTKVKMDGDS